MRIVHVLTVPFSFRLLKGQAAYLHARGYDVHAVSSPGRLAGDYAASEPVTVHRVPMTRATRWDAAAASTGPDVKKIHR